MNISDIVISKNGRDTGKRFIIIGEEEGYSLIADGKGRRLEKPKRKKNKHLRFESKADDRIAAKITENEKITNSEIRKYLTEYEAKSGEGG